ncbi:MAG: dynamin family protein [Halieaceae bacterium]|jgi:GTPase SAR1 family protein|nr:dynamin family protein [Halieaceae bacterium]
MARKGSAVLSDSKDVQESLGRIAGAVKGFYGSAIDPMAERFSYARGQTAGEITGSPIVLMLGNHSSGKSSFINYLLQDEVQKTGLAPTDDGFTIIAYGDSDDDRDGPGLVNNPELPYTDLRHFGEDLVLHLRMKRRPKELLRHVTLVDSPGMIDEAKAESGRGFDFPGVVQWFAERADVVLMFFDPDKPGTTGETLQVFNESLRGIDHKLLIVMNKMDQFRSLHDFARAYGALCWNLGKVIPRKDLPMIFNTFVPVPKQPPATLPTEDFEAAREELAREIRRAPMRRVDNMLTQVQRFSERLRLHARVLDAAARDLRAYRDRIRIIVLLIAGSAGAAGGFMLSSSGFSEMAGALLGFAAVAALGGFYIASAMTRQREQQLIATLPDRCQQLFSREMLQRERSNDIHDLWNAIADRTRRTAEELGLATIPKLRARELSRLDDVIDVQIPRLRGELHQSLARAEKQSEES